MCNSASRLRGWQGRVARNLIVDAKRGERKDGRGASLLLFLLFLTSVTPEAAARTLTKDSSTSSSFHQPVVCVKFIVSISSWTTIRQLE